MDRPRNIVDVEQVFGVSPSPDCTQARANARYGWERQCASAIVGDVDADAGLRQRERCQRLYSASPLGPRTTQELEPRRDVVEKLRHRNQRPSATSGAFG